MCYFRRRNYDGLFLKKNDIVLFPQMISYKQSFLIKGKMLRWNPGLVQRSDIFQCFN